MYLPVGLTDEEIAERELALREREVIATEKQARFNFWHEFMVAAAAATGPIVVAWIIGKKWK